MIVGLCDWEYCRERTPRAHKRCPKHRDMLWHEEYTEHVKRLCWKEEEIPLEDFEEVLDIIHEAKNTGGPRLAAERLEAEHGIDPEMLSDRWDYVDAANEKLDRIIREKTDWELEKRERPDLGGQKVYR